MDPRTALAASLAAVALASCGADDERSAGEPPSPTVTETAPSSTVTETAPSSTVTETAPSSTVRGTATPPAPATPARRLRCGDVTITPNSGDGAFDVIVEGIGCDEARRLLKSDSGLQDWDCGPTGAAPAGTERISCRSGDRRIVFETGV